MSNGRFGEGGSGGRGGAHDPGDPDHPHHPHDRDEPYDPPAAYTHLIVRAENELLRREGLLAIERAEAPARERELLVGRPHPRHRRPRRRDRVYAEDADWHMQGRAMVKLGRLRHEQGRTEEAIPLLEKAVEQIDRRLEPTLELVIERSRVLWLAESGHAEEARKRLPKARLRFLWTAGIVFHHLGSHAPATGRQAAEIVLEPGGEIRVPYLAARSTRPAFITLFHAVTNSSTNIRCASSHA